MQPVTRNLLLASLLFPLAAAGGEWQVLFDGKTVNEYTEASPPKVREDRPHAHLGKGTFAIQGHDPKSVVYIKDVRVRVLE